MTTNNININDSTSQITDHEKGSSFESLESKTCTSENLSFYSEGHGLNTIQYNNDVINVAMARIDPLISSRVNEKNILNAESFLLRENLTSSESLARDTLTTISDVFGEDNSPLKTSNAEIMQDDSNITLVANISQLSSGNETFTVSKMNCDDCCTKESISNLTSQSEFNVNMNNTVQQHSTKLLSKSNIDKDSDYLSAVLIADNIHTLGTLTNNWKELPPQELSSPLKKMFDTEKRDISVKGVSLPDENTIKAILTEKENAHKMTCVVESRNVQSSSECWDKISTTLDLAMRKLGVSLSDKILGELKKTLANFEKFMPKQIKSSKALSVDMNQLELGFIKLASQENFAQCDLIHKQVIDDLMLKLSLTRNKSEKSSKVKVVSKVMSSKNSSIKILKAYEDPHNSKVGEGDSIKISTTEAIPTSTRTKKALFDLPLRFMKENSFVLSGVPAFFLCLILIYGFIVFLIKSW
ncbi:uncharacterized protein LOC126975590 isoform X3 [Leptidea sinapis]|nr:uncharacterized protein LOC126975590 isoform X3 [Leptidea sinapis]